MSRGFLVILAILALAFAALTGFALHRGLLRFPAGAGQQTTAQQTAAIGGPFRLVDEHGRQVDQSVLKGRWSALFFGYTNCPDACPTTLFALAQAEKQLGPKAADFQTVFISVDPARDTPAQMAKYLSNDAFPRRSLGLTGAEAQVAAAAKAYKVYYQKAGSGPDYTVNHSTFTYLMTPKGGFACVIPYNASPQEIAGHVTTAMAAGPDAQSC
ncbi:MAG TPA: SCO family protein [Phenylobacterium sp.]|jgi:protein SCO1/2|nr:SCO family protein [Phenylobacterium sp.]